MTRALLLLLFAGAAHAEFWDGNKLLSRIESSNFYEQGLAMGYVIGIADMGYGVIHCAPSNVTAGQLNDMVKNYLNNVPAQRHRSGDVIVNHVLKSTWPCADRPGRTL